MKQLFSFILLFMGVLGYATPSVGTQVRVTEDFNANWKFSLGDSPDRREIQYDDSR